MKQSSYRVVILGGGSFGSAIASLVAEKGYAVKLWLRDDARAKEINEKHRNSRYLPDVLLNEGVQATTSLEDAVKEAQLVFVAVPSSSCRVVCEQLKTVIREDAYVVSLTKGIEQSSFSLMSQVIHNVLPNHAIGVMSGPNLAKELADKQITATVVASSSDALVEAVQEVLHCSYFRVYASRDIFGVELGGALKNCYAIICGMAKALGSGENTMSLLITRSLAEMSRFAVAMGAEPMTFLGLSGVGDLIVTCMSPLSRNYRVGFAIGEGKSLEAVCEELGQVAEGVNTLKLIKHKADELSIYMPLVQGMYSILHEGAAIDSVVNTLMSATQTNDVEFVLPC